METETENLETEIQDVETGDDTAAATEMAAGDATVYTREKQALDMERANVRRAKEELATVTEAYEETNAKLAQYEKELAELRSAKKTEENKLEDMDPDMADEKVIKNIRLIEQRLAAKEKQLDEVANKITAYEKQLAQTAEQRQREKARETVINTVEASLKKHGITGATKFRNEASALADELVDTGQVGQPQTIIAAVQLMEDCYLRVKAEKEKGKKTVSVDTGKAGAAPVKSKSGIKPGTLDEVREQLLATDSWLKD